MMFKDLFINMTILISFISLGSQILKKIRIQENKSTKFQIAIGMILGALGSLLMVFSVKVSGDIIIDFRNIAIIIAAIYGGTIPVFVTAILIAVFRVAYFGVNIASFFGVAVAVINSIGCWYISKQKMSSWKKWAYATIYVLITSSTALLIVLNDRSNILTLMATYWISHFFVSAIAFRYVSYSLEANKLFIRMEEDSTKDFLTGLNNVRQFDIIFNRTIKNSIHKGAKLSLLMVDIDFFKNVNDTYGHKVGDLVLMKLATILSDNCRYSDEVFRNGGEEFTILLPNCPNSCAIQIAEQIRHSVENTPLILSTKEQISITVSIGVASFPETINDVHKLVEKADIELYKAKRTGRNRVCF